MERPALDQAVDMVVRGERCLLAVPEQPSSDAFASMVGLALVLEQLGKTATLVSASHVPPQLHFLPGTSQVQEEIDRTTDLLIDIPLGGVRPANVRWEQQNETLRVIVTPERGREFPTPAPTVTAGLYPWDTIVTIGSPDLNHLGGPFTEHAPFFYETPILNIDRGTANEFFGSVNLVPATAGTVAEVVYDLTDALGGVNLLTPDVATCLYTAILTGTHSFQSPQTTPRTFAIASALLEQHADQTAVTKHLFKTHALAELRLVGRALARLREHPSGVLWSLLSQRDFTESEGSPDILPMVLQEIVERAGDQRPITLVFERQPKTLEALLYAGHVSADDRQRLAELLRGTLSGPFVHVPLGTHAPTETEAVLADVLVPHLPHAA